MCASVVLCTCSGVDVKTPAHWALGSGQRMGQLELAAIRPFNVRDITKIYDCSTLRWAAFHV